MRRVVITGLGIVSSIGTTQAQVADSLREVRSGIEFSEEYRELGFRSQVHGPLRISPEEHIDRKLLRFMGDAAAYSHIAMVEAIVDAGLTEAEVSNPRTGLVAGSGGASTANTVLAADTLREKGARRVGPYMVPRTMSSTVAACLGTAFRIKGVGYSISSACATSAHCIGNAAELIQAGKQDMVFAGGGEELHWTESVLFDGMGALSSAYNDRAVGGLARLRRRSRRLRHLRRWRHRGGGSARSRTGPRRQDLWRAGRLRRHLGRLRHGAAVRRGRGALHASGAGRHSAARTSII